MGRVRRQERQRELEFGANSEREKTVEELML